MLIDIYLRCHVKCRFHIYKNQTKKNISIIVNVSIISILENNAHQSKIYFFFNNFVQVLNICKRITSLVHCASPDFVLAKPLLKTNRVFLLGVQGFRYESPSHTISDRHFFFVQVKPALLHHLPCSAKYFWVGDGVQCLGGSIQGRHVQTYHPA